MPHTPKLVSDQGREDLWPRYFKGGGRASPMIRECLKTTQSRQNSYADTKRKTLTFAVEDFVYLRVSPLKGMQRFHVKGKVSPQIYWPN